MIRVSESKPVEKVGGCTGCENRLTTVKQVSVGSDYFAMTFRLCPKCEKELKRALRESK